MSKLDIKNYIEERMKQIEDSRKDGSIMKILHRTRKQSNIERIMMLLDKISGDIERILQENKEATA